MSQKEYDILYQEHLELREEYAKLRAQGRKRSGGCVEAIAWLAVIGAFLFVAFAIGPDLLVTYGLVSPETMAGVLKIGTPAPVEAKPQATPAVRVITSGGGGGSSTSTRGESGLPDCSTLGEGDTTTACRNYGEQVEQPAPGPTGTPEPAYVTETCLTPPGARPCWLPEGQAWEEPQEVPLTPIVLLPPTEAPPLVFVDSACAAWRPPLVLPEGCEDE